MISLLKFKRLNPNTEIPSYATAGAAGLDIRSTETVVLRAGKVIPVSTGLAVEIPVGYEIQVRPRSGLASKGVTIANSPGTIDSDYRGEIKILLTYIGSDEQGYVVGAGERIAQLVLAKVERMTITEQIGELSETDRGEGGFGSTGK